MVDNFVDTLSQLINTFAVVISVHVLVFGPEVAPLETVDGSQVPHFPIRQTSLIEELS